MTYQVDFRALGLRIRARRKELGLTQAALAERVELSQNYIGDLERGDRIASLRTILALSYALDTSPNALMQDSLPESYFEAYDKPLTFRASCCKLGNTLSNWLLVDLPDIAEREDAPVDLSLLPPLGFMTIDECIRMQESLS